MNRYKNLSRKRNYFLRCAILLFTIALNASTISAQTVIKGTISGAGEALFGASILEKGTNNGTISDLNGNFSLTVKPDATLIVHYIGFETQEVPVEGKTIFDIVLEGKTSTLEEVVSIGYGVQKKKLNTGANINIKGDALEAEKKLQRKPITP